VNPGFVEKVIAEHPDVSDVFVYGVPAKSGAPGEKDIVAAIVVQPDTALDPIEPRAPGSGAHEPGVFG
jgi:crotonobetaine/carnitine-CoA ligase